VVREECPPTFGNACRDAYAEFFSEDPRGALAAYTAHVRRLAASCDALRASASSGGGASGAQGTTELPPEPDVGPERVADGVRAGWHDAPGTAGFRDRCTLVAALRARATRSYVLSTHGVPAEYAPDVLPADWEGALSMLRAICASDRTHRACGLLAVFQNAEQGGQDGEYWFNGPVCEVVAGALLDRREALPADDVEGRRALRARVGRIYNRIYRTVDGDEPWFRRFSARLAALDDAAGAADAQRVATELDAAVDAEGFDATATATRVLISRALRAIELLAPEQRSPHAARLAATAQRAAERILRVATERRAYLSALEALDALQAIAAPEAATRWPEVLRAEGGRHHTELSARHLAAGRPGMAWFHARIARALGAPEDGAAEAALTALHPAPVFVARVDAAGCPWAAPTPANVPPGRAVVEVELRWTQCESNERRWQTSEVGTFTQQEDRTRTVQVRRQVGGYTCGVLERNCYSRPGEWQNVTEQITERVPVERSVNLRVDHRALHSSAIAAATIRFEGRSISSVWVGTAPTLEETQSGFRRHFSATTLDDQRRTLRESLTAWLGARGGAQEALDRDTARTLVREAEALVTSDPDAADERFAQALFLASGNAQPRARDHLAQRFGIPAGPMQTTFAR